MFKPSKDAGNHLVQIFKTWKVFDIVGNVIMGVDSHIFCQGQGQ